ncbi:hypothetical protein PVAND_012424 [Polypedilum vanderplanki]|uniref:Odorant receptor n=1 Tax=Polypedilum vanderplanki TaxID=319348 RepID=A0A9J6CMG1_POLVA|nr:hypothetical protein PVAND_012424 [Polypedilum vanderplanki]
MTNIHQIFQKYFNNSHLEALEIFKVPILYLKLLGIWVPSDSSKFYKFYAYFMQTFFLYIFTLLMGAAVFEKSTLNEIAEVMTFFFTFFVKVLKCINLVINVDKFLLLLADIKKAIIYCGLPKIYIDKHLSFGKKLFLAFWLPTFVTVGTGTVLCFVNGKLSYPIWLPYDPSKENSVFLFYLSAFYQSFETLLYPTANVMMDTVSLLPIVYLVAMLEHLCDKLENLKRQKMIGRINKNTKTDNQNEFLNCVIYQRTILKLTNQTEKIFSKIIAIQGFFMSIILCTVAFILTLLSFPNDFGVFVKFFTYSMSMLLQIVIPCYYGTLLTLTHDKISLSLFHSDWIFEEVKHQRNVKILIEYSKKTLKFKAFKIFEIDLETFMRILNSAYSLFAVFKRIN